MIVGQRDSRRAASAPERAASAWERSALNRGLWSWASSPEASPLVVTEKKFEERAVDFSLFVYQGEEIVGAPELTFFEMLDLGKPVVLNFWGGLCPPCRAEMPDLQKIHDEYRDRIILFGLDVGPFTNFGTRDDGKELLEKLKITYPAGSTQGVKAIQNYRVTTMPTTVFITPNRVILKTENGTIDHGKLVEAVEELIAASALPDDGDEG